MPARYSRYRAFTAKFKEYLDNRDAWPKYDSVVRCLARKDQASGRRDNVNLLRQGKSVPLVYTAAVVELLMGKAVLNSFLKDQGLANPETLTLEQILGVVAGPAEEKPDPVDEEGDWLLGWPDTLVELFSKFIWRKINEPRVFCTSERDVRTAVDMVMTCCGHSLRPKGSSFDYAKSIAIAEDHMKTGQSEYLDRITTLWKKEPWTIMFAVVSGQKVGCTIMLPLKEGDYDDLKKGRLPVKSFGPELIEAPSFHLFFETLGMKVDSDRPGLKAKTRSLVKTIGLHYAYLSLSKGLEQPSPAPYLNVLTFKGDALNGKRMERTGFRPTGYNLPLHGFPIYEWKHSKAGLSPLIINSLRERLREQHGWARK